MSSVGMQNRDRCKTLTVIVNIYRHQHSDAEIILTLRGVSDVSGHVCVAGGISPPCSGWDEMVALTSLVLHQ